MIVWVQVPYPARLLENRTVHESELSCFFVYLDSMPPARRQVFKETIMRRQTGLSMKPEQEAIAKYEKES